MIVAPPQLAATSKYSLLSNASIIKQYNNTDRDRSALYFYFSYT